MLQLRFNILPKVLLHPKEAFEAIKNDVTLAEGLVIALIMISVAQVLSLGVGIPLFGILPILPLAGLTAAQRIVLGILLGVISFIFAGVFAAFVSGMKLLEMGGKKYVRRTIGMLGYTTVLFVIQSLITSAIIAGFLGVASGVVDIESPAQVWLGMLFVGAMMIVSLIFTLWNFIIGGRAVAEANEMHSLGEGIFSFIVGYAITGLIFMVIFHIS